MVTLPLARRNSLLKVATIDGDVTDIEVDGRTKEKAAHAYTGALTLRSHIGFCAEARVPLAAELMAGTEDPRSNAVDILDRSIAALPQGVEKVQRRWDVGYLDALLAAACIERMIDFALEIKRTSKITAAVGGLGRDTWTPSMGMDDTELAIIDYLSSPWPKDANITCIARRTWILHPGGEDPPRSAPQAPHGPEGSARSGVGGSYR